MIYGKKKILKKDDIYEDSITEFYIDVFKLFQKDGIKKGKILGFCKEVNNGNIENIFGVKLDCEIKVKLLDVFNINDDINEEYFQTVNCYFDEENKPDDFDKVFLEASQDYSEKYNRICEFLKNNIKEGVIKRVEHYGSTAIKGIPAKPVVDILLQTENFEEAIDYILPVLDRPEWEYWLYKDHMIFIGRDKFQGKREYHIHIAPKGHRLWDGIIFRDYLNSNPETAQEYAKLKKELSVKFKNDRQRYTNEKSEFIKKILQNTLI